MAKRRSNGEGTIFRWKTGGWAGRLTMGIDGKGMTVRRTVYGKTQAEVKDKLEELKRQRSTGVTISNTRRTLSEWLDDWLKNHVEPSARPSTYETYESAVRLFIKPRIGAVPLVKLTAEHVDRMLSGMAQEKMTDRQRHKAFSTLRRALNVAMRRQVVAANPCSLVDPPKYNAPEAKTLTVKQAAKVVERAGEIRNGAIVVLALASGLRLGELLGLQWADIDFDANTVTVRRTQRERKGHISFGDPKTKSGRRRVTLDDATMESLNRHRAAMFREGQDLTDEGPVFVAERGGPIRRNLLHTRTWKPLLDAAGVSAVPFHSLRHTSATLMLAGGIHPKVAQSRLGHSRIGVTLDTYSHVMAGMDQEAASVIGLALNARPEAADVG